MSIPRYVVIEKPVGATPLLAMESWRRATPGMDGIPLAYAGRLDPLASGKLLVLIGEECKQQGTYHGLAKEYEFSVLFGVASDTGDVMGRLRYVPPPPIDRAALRAAAKSLVGSHQFPYPAFSSKPVQGKPLHTWAALGRLDEIEIPTYTARIYSLACTNITTTDRRTVFTEARAKIDSIPPVTELRKALGNDFRRDVIRADWDAFLAAGLPEDQWTIAQFTATVGSGTYIRSLAPEIGQLFKTPALAFHIHRTQIGRFQPLPWGFGWWRERF